MLVDDIVLVMPNSNIITIKPQGLVVVAPDYIKSSVEGGEFPAGLDDCYAALQYLGSHKGELGITDQIMATGDSAGGALSLALALMSKVLLLVDGYYC